MIHLSKTSVSVLVASLMFLTGCEKKDEQPQTNADVRPVKAVKIATNQVANQLRYSGEIRSRYESQLGFRVSGKIIKRFVDVGAFVKKGDPIAQLDAQDFNLNAQGAQQQLISAKAELMLAQAEYNRVKNLVDQKFVSESNLDKSKTQLDVIQAKVQQIQSQVAQSTNQSHYTQLVADRDGVISQLSAEVGQVVSAGQPIAKLIDQTQLEVFVSIPENQIELVKNTADISLKLWANDTQSYQLKLRELSPQADSASRTYLAKFTIVNADEKVRLGMTANVDLQAVFHNDVIQLPITVIFENAKHQASVWLVQNSRAVQKPVQIVGYHNDTVLLSKQSLNVNDIVVTAGVHLLHENQQVAPEFNTSK